MNEIETFERADRALADIVGRIPADMMDQPLPDDFPNRVDRTFTFGEMLAYQAYDEAWIPDMVAGRTVEQVGEDTYGDPFENDLLEGDPTQRFGELVEASVEAVRGLNGTDIDARIVHYSYGDYPAREALWHAIVFRTTRAFDFARAIGADTALPDELVEATWAIVEPNAKEWHEIGVFDDPVEVAEDAALQDRLMALTGRRP